MALYFLLGIILSIYCTVVYFAGTFLGLHGTGLWIFRGCLALMGLIATAAYLWYQLGSLKRTSSSGQKKGGGEAGAEDDAGQILREASARLAASELGRKAKFRNLPVILLVGKAGSTKTSTMIHSGLEPELLAGHVYRDNTVVPTAAANVWYARRAVFVEAGGKLPAQGRSWRKFIRKLRPAGIGSLLGIKSEAPRAAVVCISCEEFLAADGGAAVSATARELRRRLEEISKGLGVRLPVYVLFTKTDRIAFFAEFVRNLTPEEAGQAVGITLPVEMDQASGVYAEQQTRKLAAAFDRLFRALCDRRPDLLAREHDPQNLPGVYEFPRELRKLRTPVVDLLVDLCRPSQLRAGPFLRGFYFSGVRAVIRQEAPMQAPTMTRRRPDFAEVEHATGVFAAGQVASGREPGAPAQAPVARKVPQWVFLSHLFHDVFLGDREALGAGGASVKTSRWRRILLAMAALVCFVWIIGMVVSYFGNRALQAEALAAARGIGAAEARGGELASLDALQRLDVLRQSLETLTRYERDGAPWRLRWGLYSGDDLYPSVRRAYYTRFHQLLFASTHASLIYTLQRLPAKPSPTDEYGPVYDTLKAYLITTSHPEKSTREFLAPVLMEHWTARRTIDKQRIELARKQFDFYAEDLKVSNPFSSAQDRGAVERGRHYLSQFAGVERVYRFMLTEASKLHPSVNFNRQFPGSAKAVINNREISGAFTSQGWAFMDEAVKNADRFFGGEQWVLGDQAAAGIDPARLEEQLRKRYLADFISQWREYLRSTAVVRYQNLADAAAKLNLLSGNQSPLLAALWLASQNTAVDSEPVKAAFQPVQLVVPPENKDRYIGDSNAAYMNALAGLQASVEQAANASGALRDAVVAQVTQQATAARIITRQLAQKFRIDPSGQVGPTVEKLLEEPILYAEALVRALGPAELNAKGRSLCAQFGVLMRKYPFRPEATAEATLAEVAAIFQPGTGALWSFYNQSLREYLVRQGEQFVANPASKIRLNPAFVRFFNRAASFSEALYPGGSAQAKLAYNVTLRLPAGMQSISLMVDNQMLTAGRGGAATLGFIWPGSGAQQVRLVGRFGGSPPLTFASYQGLWAVFRFFGDADRSRTAGNVTSLEWVPKQGRAAQPMRLPDGSPLTVRFEVQSSAPVFQKGYLSGLACVSRVAR